MYYTMKDVYIRSKNIFHHVKERNEINLRKQLKQEKFIVRIIKRKN